MSDPALDDRFRAACGRLEALFAEVLDAREAARDDPATWAGWAVRFNQRLRGARSELAITMPPPEAADPRLSPLYEAGIAVRAFCDEVNRALQGHPAEIARRRIETERALRLAWDAAAGDAL